MRHLYVREVFLLSALSLGTGQAIIAQSVGNTPSTPPAPAQPTQQVSSQTSPAAVLKLADVVKKAENEGTATTIQNYIAEDIGIKITSTDSSPVLARAMSDAQRELYVVDDTGALLFLMKDGNDTFAYLANHAGVLQAAGYFYPGRFHSQEFKSISKQKAADGFAAEKMFWVAKISPPTLGGKAKSALPGTRPETAPAAPKVAGIGPKTIATKPAAVADEKDLSQMTPKERVKYLDQQIREAKREEKLEKKESAKEKKLARKTDKSQGAKDDKSAGKNPPAPPANSGQQSNSDSEAAPPKKKISWF